MQLSLFSFNQAINDVLLADLKNICGQPVKDQTALKIHENKGKKKGRDEHHPLLRRFSSCRRHLLAYELGDAHQDWSYIVRVADR
jgi:hypothetical protein